MSEGYQERMTRERAQADEARLQFIQTELESCETFLKLAKTELSFGEPRHAAYTLEKAEAALGQASDYIDKARERRQETAQLMASLDVMRSAITQMRSDIEKSQSPQDLPGRESNNSK